MSRPADAHLDASSACPLYQLAGNYHSLQLTILTTFLLLTKYVHTYQPYHIIAVSHPAERVEELHQRATRDASTRLFVAIWIEGLMDWIVEVTIGLCLR